MINLSDLQQQPTQLQQLQQNTPFQTSSLDQEPNGITQTQLEQLIQDPTAISAINQSLSSTDIFLPTIQLLLEQMNQTTLEMRGGGSLGPDAGSKALHSMAQSVHFLAQSAQTMGQAIPASVSVRLEAGKLNAEVAQQQQQQAFQQQMQLADQTHRHQLEREMHTAKLQQMQHQSLLNEHKQDEQLRLQQELQQQQQEEQQEQEPQEQGTGL